MQNVVVSLKKVSKFYKLYEDNKDRLKEALHPFGKRYHKPFYALRDIDLDVHQGEILGIVGKNGSGKSTLLKIISKVLSANSGTVHVKGNVSALLELGAGFNVEFNGIENIYFYGTVIGLSKQQIDTYLDDIIAFADIGEFIYQPLKSYSSGMKSRLAFAVAVHVNPDILILDEVLSVGDSLFKRKSYAKMEELFLRGTTVIFVSHDLRSIVELCTRAILIHEHTIIMNGTPKDVVSRYQELLFSKNQPDRVQKPKGALLKKKSEQTPYFIPDFVSKSKKTIGEQSATITHIELCDQFNNPVNILHTHQVYTLKYHVIFHRNCTKVACGAQITTIKGLRLSGASMSNSKEYLSVTEHQKFEITWSFTCKLLQGTYFFNIGVADFNAEESIFMSRIIDAYAFKVETIEKSPVAGFITLDQRISYQELSSEDQPI